MCRSSFFIRSDQQCRQGIRRNVWYGFPIFGWCRHPFLLVRTLLTVYLCLALAQTITIVVIFNIILKMLIHVKSLADHHSPDLNFKLSQSEMDYLTTYLPGQDVQCLRHARAMTRSRANRRGRPPTRLRRPGEDLQSCIFCISIKVDKVDREFSIKLRMVVGRDGKKK